jgi:hypothetical protein
VLITFLKAESNSNKPIRSQQRHVKLTSSNDISGRGVSSSQISSRPTEMSDSKSPRSSRSAPLFNMKVAATAVKDELTDIFESIVYADSASERLENSFEIIKRHKLLLSFGAAALVLKTQIGGKG